MDKVRKDMKQFKEFIESRDISNHMEIQSANFSVVPGTEVIRLC